MGQFERSRMTLSSLQAGAVEERFQVEVARVAANILDQNTEAKKPREVIVKIKFIPKDDDRRQVDIETTVTSKLQAARSVVSMVGVGHDRMTGKYVAQELPSSMPMDHPTFDD